jgi:hypothetical protein
MWRSLVTPAKTAFYHVPRLSRFASTSTMPAIKFLIPQLIKQGVSKTTINFLELYPDYIPTSPLPTTKSGIATWAKDVALEIQANTLKSINTLPLETTVTKISSQYPSEGPVSKISADYMAGVRNVLRKSVESGALRRDTKVNLEKYSRLVKGLPKSAGQAPKALKKMFNTSLRLSAQFVPGSSFSNARLMLNIVISSGNISNFLRVIAESDALPTSLLNDVYALLRYYMAGGKITKGDNHEHSIAVRIAGYVLLGASHYLQQLGYTEIEIQAIMPYVLKSYGEAISDELLVTPQRGIDNNLCTRATNNIINGMSIEAACDEATQYGATTTFEKGAKAGELQYPDLLTGSNKFLGVPQIAGTTDVYAASFTTYYKKAFTKIAGEILEPRETSFTHPDPRTESGVKLSIGFFKNVAKDFLSRSSGGGFEVTEKQAEKLGNVFALAITDIILDHDPNDESELTNSQTYISKSVEVNATVKETLDVSKEAEIIKNIYICGFLFKTTCLDTIPKRMLFPEEISSYTPLPPYTRLSVNPIPQSLRGTSRLRGGKTHKNSNKTKKHRKNRNHTLKRK